MLVDVRKPARQPRQEPAPTRQDPLHDPLSVAPEPTGFRNEAALRPGRSARREAETGERAPLAERLRRQAAAGGAPPPQDPETLPEAPDKATRAEAGGGSAIFTAPSPGPGPAPAPTTEG